jgi:predicted nucleic acid-binding Zn ribbon protein
VRLREDRLRDLGGLMLEMFRRDQFRQDMLVDRCGELLALEERLAEIDALLAAAVSRGKVRPAAHCECGAPIFWGAKFCGQCGREVQPA